MLNPEPRRWVDYSEALLALSGSSAIPACLPDQAAAGPAGWLDGVRVLDLCNVIAGPHASFYLARFGAEVIKLDPTCSLLDSAFTIVYALNNMRGKRSVLADIRSSGGREIFEKLVKAVDVIVWNATDRQVNSMGLDLEGFKALNPEAIFCQLDAYSGVRRGARSDYLGYDNLVQAATGITMRFSGNSETPEDHAASAGTLDVNGGLGAALGVAVALYQRVRTGRAGRARTSLSALSGLVQVPFCYDYEGRAPFDEPSGIGVKGYGPLAYLYETADGRSLMLSAIESDLPRFAHVKGLEKFVDVPAEARISFLTQEIAKSPADEWASRFHAAGIGAAACENIDAIRSTNSRPADGTPGTGKGSYSWSIFCDHPSGHVITLVDPYAIRPMVAKIYAPPPAEKYGASTRHVLRELQYGEAEIDKMLAEGAVSESWSREYLPS